ncbi:hypothetical protein CR513_57127, partial [Mucuna pruriens]
MPWFELYFLVSIGIVNLFQVPKARAHLEGSMRPIGSTTRSTKPIVVGRVFVISGAKASKFDNLISGKCDIAGNLFFVLFNLGATHSFISYLCCLIWALPIHYCRPS